MTGRALVFDGVSRWYGDTVALADVSFALGPGVTGLLGHNGAGKSTALKLCAGFTPPSTGTVRVLGMDLSRDPDAYPRIGIAHDRDALWPFLTARAMVALCARLRGVPDPEAAADRSLGEVGLADAADRSRPRLLPRHAPAREARAGARPRPRAAAAGRAPQRPRPGPAAPHRRAHRAPGRARAHGPRLLARPARGRAHGPAGPGAGQRASGGERGHPGDPRPHRRPAAQHPAADGRRPRARPRAGRGRAWSSRCASRTAR